MRDTTTSTTTTQKVVRLSVNLSQPVADTLRWIATKHGISITDAVRRSISTQVYIEEAYDRGAKILVKELDSPTLRELVFVR